MRIKKLLFVSAATVLLAAGCGSTANNTGSTQPQGDTGNTQAQSQSNGGSTTPAAGQENNVKTFTVEGGGFYFKPAQMTVNKGDKVRIVFTNVAGFHDWVLDEFNARTKQLQAGQSETIEFVADKTGTFEYYCSVGNHRAMGMKGTLTVQ